MKNLLTILIGAARAKMMPLWIKLRMWSSPTFLKAQVLVRIREFFTKLLDVKPRNKWDYYSVFRWQVSKRLAFALVVALGLVAALYIAVTLPKDFLSGEGSGVPTYEYRALPLNFHSGKVRILARNLFSTLLRVCPEDGIVRWYLFACEHCFNRSGGEAVDYRLFGMEET